MPIGVPGSCRSLIPGDALAGTSIIDLLPFVPSDTSRSFAALPDCGCLCPQRIDGEKMQNTLTSVFGFLVLFTSAHNRSGPANKSSGHREQDLPTP
jgi:hypothetical protein